MLNGLMHEGHLSRHCTSCLPFSPEPCVDLLHDLYATTTYQPHNVPRAKQLQHFLDASPVHASYSNIVRCFGVCRVPNGCDGMRGLSGTPGAGHGTWGMILEYCEVSWARV